ncbi:MAG: hypothetical protein KatS3mg053_1402 [Candidatus Roseilinea sp.]|nr:MAG: hypothetical protein KatS3mg053_1402 [Candidatus Roseilinea sp.]
MSSELNKALVRRLMEEVFNGGNFKVADEIVAVDYHSHDPLPGEGPGRAGMAANIQAIRTAFPDVRFEAEQILAEGDRVVVRWRATGTHRSEFIGIPATGQTSVTTGMTMYRIANGQIVESWNNWDALGMMQQLGVLLQAADS